MKLGHKKKAGCWKRDVVVASYVDSRSSTLPGTSAKSLSGTAMMIAAMFTRVDVSEPVVRITAWSMSQQQNNKRRKRAGLTQCPALVRQKR